MDQSNTTPAPAPNWHDAPLLLSDMTTELAAEMNFAGTAVALVPIGSTEPHGPHLPLGTDAILSEEVCKRAARLIRERGRPAVVAPVVSYGVTRYAEGFRGVVGLSDKTLVALMAEIGRALLDDGFVHVAFVNNHLEPAHVAAIERAVSEVIAHRGPSCVSFPNQLSKRWGRTLTEEFKRGDCHAGRYETSLVLASRPDSVRKDLARDLPSLTISLSEAMKNNGGKPVTFGQIGMVRAYTGAPAEGTEAEGEATYRALVDMVVAEVDEHMEDAGEHTARNEILGSPHPAAVKTHDRR